MFMISNASLWASISSSTGSRNHDNSLWTTGLHRGDILQRKLLFSLCFKVGNSTILPFDLLNTYCCFAFINSYPSYHIPETMSRNQDRRTCFLLEQGTAFAVAKSTCNIGWRSQFWCRYTSDYQSIYIHSCNITLFVILRVLPDSRKYALPIRYNWCTRIIHGTRLKKVDGWDHM